MATRHRLTPHFAVEEFDCKDPKRTRVPDVYLPALEYLCRVFLEPMRAQFGGSCTVLSGYRTAAHNRTVGGAKGSFHIYTEHELHDVAADVRFPKGSVRAWWLAAQRIRLTKRHGKGGIGYYPEGGFVHIDVRNYRSDWNGS